MVPSPADLTYFIEVAHTLNLSRAAERLGISQPSLSLAMQRLEHAVGVPLLTRGKRGVVLTQAGRQLHHHARSLLQVWEGVRTGAQTSMREIRGSYVIGCHASVALHSLSGFLPGLMAAHPDLHVSLRHDLSRKIAADVIGSKVDAGIVVNPVQHPDLIIHPLCRDEVRLWSAVKKHNPSVLVCDPDLVQTQSLLGKMKKAGFVFGRIITSDNLEVIADITAHGGGIGILPAQVARRARKKLEQVAHAPVFYDEHCLIYRMENRNVKALQAINAAIRDFFRTDGARTSGN
ncbi:MAG: LysR family transcriptional regulator [Alphaproteobacteria bacterium]|nr:LysR family transcriptional regulator [Alphaproteobacteria bacterium]MDE2335990.1 LysR family transcriptional regulator [Alphaproteobacteria bacterium]